MKPAPTAVIGYGLLACGLWLWLASPRAEAQPVPGERDSQQLGDAERPPTSEPGAEPYDPAAGPHAEEPGRFGASSAASAAPGRATPDLTTSGPRARAVATGTSSLIS